MKISELFERKAGKELTLEEKHEKLRSLAAEQAKISAQRGLPKPKGDSISNYIGQFQSAYKGLLLEYAKPASNFNKRLAEMEKSTLAIRQKALEVRLKDAADKHRRLMLERDALPEAADMGKSEIGSHIIAFLIALCEALVTRKSLQIYESNSNVLQLVFLVVLVAIFMMLPRALVTFYRRSEGTKNKWVLLAGVGAFIVVCFTVLSHIRLGFIRNSGLTTVESSSDVMGFELSAWHLTVLQLFLLFIACFSVAQLRTKEQKLQLHKRQQVEAKLAAAENEISRTERELNAMPDRMLQTEISREDSALNVAAMQAKIRSFYTESVALYIDTNKAYRSDHEVPDCFAEPIPTI